MANLITLFKIIAVLTAAGLLGNWFLSEVKKSKLKGDPGYKAYFSLPGIIIILLVLLLPIIAHLLKP